MIKEELDKEVEEFRKKLSTAYSDFKKNTGCSFSNVDIDMINTSISICNPDYIIGKIEIKIEV